MNRKWFLLKESNVLGPYDFDGLNWELQIYPEGLVWGPGLNEWISGVEWRERLTQVQIMLTALKEETTPQWWLKDGNVTRGPYIYHDLIQEMKKSSHAGDLEIRQGITDEYRSVYDFPTLVEEIGITRRKHSRVPLQGVFRVQIDGQWQEIPTTTISVGGFGLQEGSDLQIGQSYRGEILSTHFGLPVFCVAEVLSKQKNGTWGLKFEDLPFESQTILISYIKKFSKAA